MVKQPTPKQTTSISGESIGLAFVGVGLLWAYLLPQVFSAATPYVSAACILFGFAGFMVSLQSRFKDSQVRWINGAVGLVVGVVPGWLLFVAYNGLDGFWRGAICLVLSFVLLLGAAAFFDFLVSIFEYFVQRNDDFGSKLSGFVKFIALVASTIAAVYATLNQLL